MEWENPMTTATASPSSPTAWEILREMIEKAWNTLCFALIVFLVVLMV